MVERGKKEMRNGDEGLDLRLFVFTKNNVRLLSKNTNPDPPTVQFEISTDLLFTTEVPDRL